MSGVSKEERKRRLAYSAFDEITEGKVSLRGNLCFGAAGACLAIVLLTPEASATPSPLWAALFCASIAMPMWVGLGVSYEFLLHIGEKSYAFLKTPRSHVILGLSEALASLLMVVSIGALLYSAGVGFLIAFVIGLSLALRVYFQFSNELSDWAHTEGSKAPAPNNSSKADAPDGPQI